MKVTETCRACSDAVYHSARAELLRQLSDEIRVRSGQQFASHRDDSAIELRVLADSYGSRVEAEYRNADEFLQKGVHADGCATQDRVG